MNSPHQPTRRTASGGARPQARVVAVVGGGIGGLLAAALLRKQGVDVVRLERASQDGGRGRSPRLGGMPVNLGPRALYRGGPLAAALAAAGVHTTGFSPASKGALAILRDDEDAAGAGDALAPIPGSLPDLLSSPLLRGADKRAFALAFARLAVGALDVDSGEDVGAWLARHAPEGNARALLATLVRVATYSDDPRQDAALALAQTRRALTNGVTYVDGGWQSIVDRLRAAAGPAEQRDVRSLADVDDAGADAVILALPEDEAARLVPWRAASLAEPAKTPVTASCLDVVLRALPRPQQRVAFGLHAPLYFSVHTRAGDDGGGAIIAHAMVNGSAPRARLERVLDLVQPGWRDFAIEARYLSRMVVASSLAAAGAARARARVDDRTFLVGDYVDTGFLLADGVARSALDAVAAVSRLTARGAMDAA